MLTSEKQAKFDKQKWIDSEIAGHDTCGTYDYCAKCNKENEFPCAMAHEDFTNVTDTPAVVEEAPKAPAKKACATKKSCAKKTTAKKTTAKKTSTKKTK